MRNIGGISPLTPSNGSTFWPPQGDFEGAASAKYVFQLVAQNLNPAQAANLTKAVMSAGFKSTFQGTYEELIQLHCWFSTFYYSYRHLLSAGIPPCGGIAQSNQHDDPSAARFTEQLGREGHPDLLGWGSCSFVPLRAFPAALKNK